ncbi:ComF family protein [Oenococcus alcoholitolerans]|uniref:ComF family protein n=1 Tax=Oenococcus alcoholitolerans TaxID=931074 RepID=UPI003F6F4F8B
MRHYKFNGDYRYKDIFREDLKKIFFSRIKRADFFIPIPLSDESQMNRGFNQVTGLFSFAEKYIRNDFLILKGEKTQSSKLGRRQRMAKNNPFVCLKSLPENPHIILADDVYTTGATLHHAADTLKKAGAGIIESITLAR